MTRAIAGYTGANVTITTGGTYTGGGVSGYSGGSAFVLCLSERSYEILRKWVDTICDQYQQGLGITLGANIQLDGYYRDNGEPPSTITDEVIKISLLIGNRTLSAAIGVESFKGVGKAGGESAYTLKGRTDGTFTLT